MLGNQIRGNAGVTFFLNSFFVIVKAMHIFCFLCSYHLPTKSFDKVW